MISTLSQFDKIAAAGILARAALSIDDEDNPAAEYKIPEEPTIRRELLARVRESLGVSPSDDSVETLEKVTAALDRESDLLAEPVDSEKALNSLSAKGELPSDLYQIVIDDQVMDLFAKRGPSERKMIEATVRRPDHQQHFIPEDADSSRTPLISLFSKFFENRYSNKNFTMLLAAQREGLTVYIRQAWRVYADRTKAPISNELVELLRRFSDDLGFNVRLDGAVGKFFLNVEVPENWSLTDSVEVRLDDNVAEGKGKGGFKCMLAHFDKRDPDGKRSSSLVYAINLLRYRSVLDAHGWESESEKDWAYPIGDFRKQ